MKNRHLHIFILVCFILLSVSLLLTGCTKQEEEVEEITEPLVSIGDNESTRSREREVDVIPDFAKGDRDIGEFSEVSYNLVSVRDTAMPGFHRIVFETEATEEPNVLASYDEEINAIRLTFKSLLEDTTGLSFGESFDIYQDCVLDVTRVETEEESIGIYDVRISDIEGFRIYSQSVDENGWSVFLDIQYLDLEEAVADPALKTVGDAVASDGARVVSYYYELDGNVFRFVWGARSSESKPIPKVQGRYNADNDIIIVFPDLESDYIAADSHEIEMSGVIEGVSWNRTDGESMYKFDLREKRDFELKSNLDPDEVILEITLW